MSMGSFFFGRLACAEGVAITALVQPVCTKSRVGKALYIQYVQYSGYCFGGGPPVSTIGSRHAGQCRQWHSLSGLPYQYAREEITQLLVLRNTL